jgi:beta-lactamase regulating signal transducer with metallopeptidase domain
MNFINLIISQELVYALGWAVVHSLWQAAAVALLLAVVMLALRRQAAKVRYRAAYGALLIVFGLAVATFVSMYAPASSEQASEITRLTQQSQVIEASSQTSSAPDLLQRFTSYFHAHLPLIVTVWLLGVAFFALRLLGGLGYVHYLKTAHVFQVDEKWRRMLHQQSRQLALKRLPQLLESALVRVPIVIGHFKPVVLLPVGVVNALAPEQVEAILAHELAHIARRDYLWNILQSFIEALFYFNPAVWLISTQIRSEREHCCDDLAVELCGNALHYAKALVAIQEMNQTAPVFAMAFGKKKKQLLQRIQRILNQSQNRPDIMEKIITTSLLIALLLVLTVSAVRPHEEIAEAKPVALMATDTLPQRGKMHFKGDYEGKNIETTVRDGAITHLKIDGKEIPASEYGQYENLIGEIMTTVPKPPPPPPALSAPPAPAPPSVNAPPAPPAPPRINDYEAEMRIYEEQLQRHMEELQAKEEALREVVEKRQRRAEAEAEEMRVLQQQRQKEIAVEIEKKQKQLRETERRMREEYEASLAARERAFKQREAGLMAREQKNLEMNERFEQQMLKDGLIEDADNYRLDFSRKRMRVNGKTVPAATAEQYYNIYQEILGKELCDDCRFEINKRRREE